MPGNCSSTVEAGRREEAAGNALDDGAARLDLGLVLVRKLGGEILPELQVEIGVGLDLDLVARAQHARTAEIVDDRIGGDFRALRVVEADIGRDVHAVDRLEQVDDDDRDAGLRGADERRLDGGDLGRRNSDEVHLALDHVLDDADLLGKGRRAGRRLRQDLDVEAVLVGIRGGQLEEVGGRLEDAGNVRRHPADGDVDRLAFLRGRRRGVERRPERDRGGGGKQRCFCELLEHSSPPSPKTPPNARSGYPVGAPTPHARRMLGEAFQ
jgi:hypothetical protein